MNVKQNSESRVRVKLVRITGLKRFLIFFHTTYFDYVFPSPKSSLILPTSLSIQLYVLFLFLSKTRQKPNQTKSNQKKTNENQNNNNKDNV